MINEYVIKEILNGLNMGMISIDYFEDKVNNPSLRDIMLKLRKDYGDLKNKLRTKYPEVEDILKQKFMVETMLKFKSMMSNDQKITKMMIEGCNQGIMTMNELLNKEHISEELKQDINTLNNISHYYIQKFKPYL